MNSESEASPAEVPGGGPTEGRPNQGIVLRVAQNGGMSFSTIETQQTATAGLDPWFEDNADFPARESGHTSCAECEKTVAGEVQCQGHHLIDPKLRPGGKLSAPWTWAHQ